MARSNRGQNRFGCSTRARSKSSRAAADIAGQPAFLADEEPVQGRGGCHLFRQTSLVRGPGMIAEKSQIPRSPQMDTARQAFRVGGLVDQCQTRDGPGWHLHPDGR